jgi:hypothetical protein
MKSFALLCRCASTTSFPKRSNWASSAPMTTLCAMQNWPMTKRLCRRSWEITWKQRCNCARWKKLESRHWKSMRFSKRDLKLLILYSGLKILCSQRSLVCCSGQKSPQSKPLVSSMMTRTANSQGRSSQERLSWWKSTISQRRRSTSSGTHSIWISQARLTSVSSLGNSNITALEIAPVKSSSSLKWSKRLKNHRSKV